jgi:hypothetical protein
MSFMSRLRQRIQQPGVARHLVRVVVCLALAGLLPSDGYLGPSRVDFTVNRAVGSHTFDLVAWEAQALSQKARDAVARPGAELSPAQQRDLALVYFDGIARLGRLSWEIERIYADAARARPDADAAPVQAQIDALRAEQAARRPAVERIIEQQIAAVLTEAGLLTWGRVLPPVRFQLTESPANLIVSPRERIRIERTLLLDPGLAVSEMERIEDQLQLDLDVSALVEGTGGIGSYPTMVLELPNLAWTLNTVAHEWAHNYLVFRPLGFNYFDSGETRTLNETVASIIGDEIGEMALARFYPELVPTPAPPPAAQEQPPAPPAPPAFQFGPFMRETRLAVDKLLVEGRVVAAEAYMEARRQRLLEQGYLIRKLNQAYFAFHGSYAAGEAGADPIGGKLRELRRRAASLAAFVRAIEGITSVAELDAVLERTP